jgi:ribose 5-phosphate isomerase A
MTMRDTDREKRAAAEAAVAEVQDGMLVGLGTGSTAAFVIAALGRRCREGLAIRTVATSLRTEAAASAQGIAVLDFAAVSAIDLAIDGVDEIDPQFRAIKGAGGAMLREKIVAQAAARMIAVCDAGKPVARLSRGPLPVEVLPFAQAFVAHRIEALGVAAQVRVAAGEGPYRTDQHNLVFDCLLPPALAVEAFAADIEGLPGVIGHGFFPDEIDAVYVGRGEAVERRERR